MTEAIQDPTKEEFALQVEYITETHKAFIENTAKVAGFLLLALGWYATSNEARAFLAYTRSIAVISAIAVAAAYLLSVGASWIAYQSSTKAVRRLNELSYLPQSSYEGRILGRTTFIVCVAGNGVLSALLMKSLLTTILSCG